MSDKNDEESRLKVLDRIRRLLAMGSDKSSQNEAAIALRRARSLMDEHQVTLLDIENINNDSLGEHVYESNSSRQKLWVNGLAMSVAEMNDCILRRAQRFSKKANIGYVFQGFKEDTKLCEFMLVYLVDTCLRLYKRDKKELGIFGAAEKNDYLSGISDGIRQRIKDIITERNEVSAAQCTGRSLVVAKKAAVEKEFGTSEHRSVKRRDPDLKAYIRGIVAADEIHLENFLESDSAEKLHLE